MNEIKQKKERKDNKRVIKETIDTQKKVTDG